MPTTRPAPTTVDEYIAGFPPEVQSVLQAVRTTIRQAAPEAHEAIKYGIPTFVQHGNVVHFAGYAHHIGFYPLPATLELFQERLAGYKRGKGSVQFPLSRPIPHELIRDMTLARLAELSAKRHESP